MSPPPSQRFRSDARRAACLDAASTWVARHDRGLSSNEAVEFERWLQQPENREAWSEIEGPFAALDRSALLRPTGRTALDADLLAPKSKQPSRRLLWATGGFLAAAASLAIALYSPATVSPRVPPATGVIVRHSPEVRPLPDGSTVELKTGTNVEIDFTPAERRVRLDRGDAHFTVAKDADRPFIVTVGNVTVRAVGTAFSISASSASIEVLVTEGRVRVGDVAGNNLIEPRAPISGDVDADAPLSPPVLDAGELVVIPVIAAAGPIPVTTATAEILERATAWRSVWLEFGDMPLADVTREFNRYAADMKQPLLKVADAATGRMLVSGTFRADGIDAFVRLLHSSFRIDALPQSDGSLAFRKLE